MLLCRFGFFFFTVHYGNLLDRVFWAVNRLFRGLPRFITIYGWMAWDCILFAVCFAVWSNSIPLVNSCADPENSAGRELSFSFSITKQDDPGCGMARHKVVALLQGCGAQRCLHTTAIPLCIGAMNFRYNIMFRAFFGDGALTPPAPPPLPQFKLNDIHHGVRLASP